MRLVQEDHEAHQDGELSRVEMWEVWGEKIPHGSAEAHQKGEVRWHAGENDVEIGVWADGRLGRTWFRRIFVPEGSRGRRPRGE